MRKIKYYVAKAYSHIINQYYLNYKRKDKEKTKKREIKNRKDKSFAWFSQLNLHPDSVNSWY